jgi:hypothetical protein
MDFCSEAIKKDKQRQRPLLVGKRFYIPTHRGEAAMDGAPDLLGLVE